MAEFAGDPTTINPGDFNFGRPRITFDVAPLGLLNVHFPSFQGGAADEGNSGSSITGVAAHMLAQIELPPDTRPPRNPDPVLPPLPRNVEKEFPDIPANRPRSYMEMLLELVQELHDVSVRNAFMAQRAGERADYTDFVNPLGIQRAGERQDFAPKTDPKPEQEVDPNGVPPAAPPSESTPPSDPGIDSDW